MDRTQTYQIKSTPFMRRMVSTHTKNGELQRLKEEYERINHFNQRTLEEQIKQARLRRLYHVIECIRKSQPARQHARTKTKENWRAEQINRAREMGMQYSRNNAVVMEQKLGHRTSVHSRPENLKFSFEPHKPKEEAAKRNRSYRRLTKGNEFSRRNLEVLSQTTSRRRPSTQVTEQVDPIEAKRKLIMKAIKYGNEKSTKNMVQLQTMKSNTQEQHREMAQMHWLDSINNTHAAEWSPSQSMVTAQQDTEFLEEQVGNCQSVEIQAQPQPFMEELPTIVTSVIPETTLTTEPTMTTEDNTLKVVAAMTPPQADSTFQQVRRLVMDTIKMPFSGNKSKSMSEDFQQNYEQLSEMETLHDHATLENVMDDDEEQNKLHQVSNSTNLQNLYENIKVQDLGSNSSDLIITDTSAEEHLTPDELVLNCQNYMDNKNESEERQQSRYDSNNIHPFEKFTDLRSKLVEPISTHVLDKEQLLILRKVQDLRSIFEN